MGNSIILYHREDCHLCEQALALLQDLGLRDSLQLLDIDSDAELGVEFGLRIPVLLRADGCALDWPFDAQQVQAWLQSV